MFNMSYAVTWSEDGGPLFAGSLEVGSTCLSLVGTARFARASRQHVRYTEMTDIRIERVPESRLMGRPTLVVQRPNGTQLRISALSGAGMLNEIVERVSGARGQAGDTALAGASTA